MAITPSLKDVESISQIMARTLQNLHQFIETQGNHDKPEEIMVLMLSFCTGLIMQLQNKVETLEEGLGRKFLETLNEATGKDSGGLEIIKKLGTNDPSLSYSSSGIAPNDLPAAIEFLENNIRNNIKIHMDSLPYALRNEVILFNALAMVLANLFNSLNSKNANSMIDNFAENIRIFTRETKKDKKPSYH